MTNPDLTRLMGLVVALRFLTAGALLAAVCGLLLVGSVRYPGLLSYLSLPCLLAFYLLGSGHVLLLIRLSHLTSRCLVLLPVGIGALLFYPKIAESSELCAAVLGLGCWVYTIGFRLQTRVLNHLRASAWFTGLGWAFLPALLTLLIWPTLAARLSFFGGVLWLAGLWVGWRLWLRDLRRNIAERETV